MKKISLIAVFLISLLIVLASCKSNSNPAAPATPTLIATATLSATWTAVNTSTMTPTITMTSTQIDSPTATATATLTSTATLVHPYMSQFGSTGNLDTQFNYVTAMCHDENDNLYIADQGVSRIKIYNSSGVFQSAWGTLGTADAEIQYPSGICYDGSSDIYISDAGNMCIKQFSKSGVFVRKFGSVSDFGGEPKNMTFKDGYLYVMGADKVAKYSPSGVLQTTIGTPGVGVGELSSCYSIHVDSSGNIYCGTVANAKIVQYDSSGAFVREWTQGWPASMAADAAGNLMVAAAADNYVRIFSTIGTYITQFGGYDTTSSGNGLFLQPYAISVDSQGYVFVADNSTDIVQKFDK